MIIRKLKITKIIIFALLLLHGPLGTAEVNYCHGKPILGKVERVSLVGENLELYAKIDTGASGSSLSAVDIREIKYKHKTWVEFNLPESKTNKKIHFKKLLVRHAKILKRSEESLHHGKNFEVRPVILLNVCLANQAKAIEVNLTDRSQFQYPMLLGAKTLEKFNVIIDVQKKYVSSPKCENN